MKNSWEETKELKLNDYYKVPCISTDMGISPVILHKHNEGNDFHYHLDYRFLPLKNDKNKSINFYSFVSLNKEPNCVFVLKVFRKFDDDSILEILQKEIPKCNKIIEGKCPHKGYDLAQVKEINGYKTCPLHGLKVKI